MSELFELREFSKEEAEFIEKNCAQMTVGGLRESLGIPWDTIKAYLDRNGLVAMKNPKRSWTEDLDKLGFYVSKGYDDESIAKLLDRTQVAVEQAIKRYNIERKNKRNKRWTEEDEAKLRDMWGQYKIRYIARKLGRTIISVKQRATFLNLPPTIECDGGYTIAEFEEICNISRKRIDRWRSLGFPVRTVSLTERKIYMVIDVDKALDWMKEHQSEFDARFIEPHALVYEPLWLIQKRARDAQLRTKQDKKNNGLNVKLMDYENWTTKQLSELVTMCFTRRSISFMAARLDKTECSIEQRIRQDEIPYIHSYFYSDEDKLFIQENVGKKSYEWIANKLGRKGIHGLKAFCIKQGWV